jgi:dephospho-CoA kinase
LLKIGLTGGIGSGKTTIAKIFEQLGTPVYYADLRAKSIIEEDGMVRNAIIRTFGEQSFMDGKYNRSYISSIVFNDVEKLSLLNQIVHPAAIADAAAWMEKQNSSYVIKEAALLFESGSHKHLDKIIGVTSPTHLRLKRTALRDGISEEEVMKKIELQMPDEEKMALCDFVVVNNEKDMMLPQVLQLHSVLMELSNSN